MSLLIREMWWLIKEIWWLIREMWWLSRETWWLRKKYAGSVGMCWISRDVLDQ